MTKALIIRGGFKGREVEVLQWSNDWFTVKPLEDDGTLGHHGAKALTRRSLDPTELAFKTKDFNIIDKSISGMLFKWYEPIDLGGLGAYDKGFKKRI